MADYKQTVAQTTDQGVAQDGSLVREQTKQVRTDSVADGKTVASNIIWYIFGVIAILLAIRFILRLLGANAANGFVQFVYNVSGALSTPFDTVFGTNAIVAGDTRSVFEPSIIVAIAVYALIAWGLAKLLTINKRPSAV